MTAHVFKADSLTSLFRHKTMCTAQAELTVFAAYQQIVDQTGMEVGDMILLEGQYLKLQAKFPCRFQVLHPRRPEVQGLKEVAQRIERTAA